MIKWTDDVMINCYDHVLKMREQLCGKESHGDGVARRKRMTDQR